MEKIKNVDQYVLINSKINVEVLKGEYKGMYSSRIEDLNKKSVYISIPTSQTLPVPLAPSTMIEISFLNAKGRFSFKTTVKKRIKDRITMLELEKPELIYRKELRKFFRVDSRIKARVFLIDFNIEDGELNMVKDTYDVIIKDISGGGMRISTVAPLQEEQAVEFDMFDELGIRKEIFGKVAKLFPPEQNSGRFEAGIEFISIKENDRDKIIKYVFQRQIELRKLSK